MIAPVKHHTAGVIVLSQSDPLKVLLVHHRKLGVWMPPGGHAEAGENPLQNAIREAKEETGLDVTSYLPQSEVLSPSVQLLPSPTYLFEERVRAHGDEPQHYHVDAYYVARMPEQAVRHDELESHDIGWFTLDQLADLPMFDDVRLMFTREMSK
jgi:8-oxo-dGTP pyrophosphatase MutT (NUDIX family)